MSTPYTEKLHTLILSPVVTEKSQRLADKYHQVTFKVKKEATKGEIKHAVELLFKVVVTSVTVSTMKGKAKRFGRMEGRRSDWKKAYVTLAEGHDISFATAEA